MAYTTINKPSQYFNTVLYAGNNGSSQSITGVGFSPDFVWIKNRTDARNHVLTDIVRGATKTLFSQSTSAEVTNPTDGYLSSFDSDGFSVSQGSVNNENVCATDNYVSWNWDANGAGVSNTQGSITSTVSANTTAGFSIGTYTGNGTSGASIGHGLGATPAMIICKSRSDAEEWATYHQSLTYTKYIVLNSTAAANSTARFYQAPTSSLFYVDNGYGVNKSSATYVFYAFSEIKGYSKFGSYTGNGSTDGTFVYTGFKPAWVLWKNTATAGTNWVLMDNKRNTYNPENLSIAPNTSDAEADFSSFPNDFLSNGFKLRNTGAGVNASGSTYIYAAFAEKPFVSSTFIPTTAR